MVVFSWLPFSWVAFSPSSPLFPVDCVLPTILSGHILIVILSGCVLPDISNFVHHQFSAPVFSCVNVNEYEFIIYIATMKFHV